MMNTYGRWSKPAAAVMALLVVMVAGVGCTQAASLRLADKGQAHAVIVAPADWQAERELSADLPPTAAQRLKSRHQLLRDSVNDLAHYLGQMTGTTFEVVDALPAGDKRTPIYIGSAAKDVFGPVASPNGEWNSFRVVADAKHGLGLFGESEVGASYAIYELLDQLGCRWFMPTQLGEVVPDLPTLTVPVMDETVVPATDVRTFTQGNADYWRRNRMGRHDEVIWLAYGDGSLQRYFDADVLAANPEWRALNADGTPHRWSLRATHPGVAKHIADQIIAQLETAHEPMKAAGLRAGYSLTPSDGQVPTDDPYETPFDPEPRVWEAAAGRWSVSDRSMLLNTRVAEQVRARFPNVAFGDQAYVNKSLPPAKYPVIDDFRIVICPIDFNRHHPMGWPDHPNGDSLQDLVQGWNEAGADIGAYWYGINLAELSAPCPFIEKWSRDLTILRENNLREWMPETMNGWDSMLPGYHLSIRMAFSDRQTPQQILDDLWTKFYGAAAAPMEQYWTGIDQAYLNANAFAGSPYGYLKIFTPEVMKTARANIDDALAACQTATEERRVRLIDESFGLFEWYMKMRSDWAAGNVRDIEADYETWRQGVRRMQRKYGVLGKFARDGYAGGGNSHVQGRHGNPAWSDSMYSVGYRDGSRMEREYARLGKPMVEWKWKYNPGSEQDAVPWAAIDHDDTDWPALNVVRDTWSSIGHHTTLTDESSGRSGRMAYRSTQKLAAVPEGKQAYLWIGSTDGSVKVYVNGVFVPYQADKDAFNGYCKPATFDITSALKAGENQFTILADRHHLNELGTGGLTGPVILYHDK